MFKKWKEKLKRWVGGVGNFIGNALKRLTETSAYSPSREFPQVGLQELTPLEEMRIRTGYWNPRW